VIREWKVREVIQEDRVVQVERGIALAPAVARPLVRIDHQRRHAEPAEPRRELQTVLAAADDQAKGLLFGAERRPMRGAAFGPGRAALRGAMVEARRSPRAGGFLVADQLDDRGQQDARLAVDQLDMAATARRARLEAEPALVRIAERQGGVVELKARARRSLAPGSRPSRRFRPPLRA
jgi:hypothetical protein